jgi:phosphonate transport system substrate-binding protein
LKEKSVTCIPALKFTTCMAENADSTCSAIVQYLGRKLELRTEFIDGIAWEEREALLDAGRIHVCWICGLPYAWKADAENPAIELCAVPVMRGERYANRPVYFSDVVVHRDSDYAAFADLRGAAWAYNEPRSHSGHNVVLHHLATLGHRSGYFGRVVESGAHQASLRMIVNREIDASAIDSTVLEAELQRQPALERDIRVVETLGPSPMPPWVLLKSLPANVRSAIRAALLEMHTDAEGAAILQGWRIARFVAAVDADYDPLRQMAGAAADVRLAL